MHKKVIFTQICNFWISCSYSFRDSMSCMGQTQYFRNVDSKGIFLPVYFDRNSLKYGLDNLFNGILTDIKVSQRSRLNINFFVVLKFYLYLGDFLRI